MQSNIKQRADYWLHRQVIDYWKNAELHNRQSTLINAINHGLKIRVSVVRFRDWPPIQKARTRFGLFHICLVRQFWRDFADLPRERLPSHSLVLGPSRPLCSPFFSSGLASVREVTSSIGAGSGAASCGWEVVASGD